MSKKSSALRFVLSLNLVLGFSVQIILSGIWLVRNFLYLQPFSEEQGILYPLIVNIAKGIGNILPIPYYCFIYVCQLGLAFYAAWELCGSINKFNIPRRIWCSLALVSFPLALQCHLAVLPYSFVASLFIINLSQMIGFVKAKDRKVSTRILLSSICLLIAGLLKIEYTVICAIPTVIILIGYMKGEKTSKYRLHSVFTVILAMLILVGVISVDFVKDDSKSVSDDIYTSLLSRFVWPNFGSEYDAWPEDSKEPVNLYDIYELDRYPTAVRNKLVVPLKSLGKSRAKELYGFVLEQGIRNHKKQIIHDIFWDIAGYVWSPLVIERQLDGNVYEAKTGVNYEAMKRNSPKITWLYMHFGNFWFAIVLIHTLIILYHRDVKKVSRENIVLFCNICALLAFVVLYYSMLGAGMMDYKRTIYIGLLWNFLAMIEMVDFKQKNS